MKQTTVKCDPKKIYAAQNAKEGLINVSDLSLLTGIPTTELTTFAKTGLLNHYGEYHGKRFYNFEEVVNWASNPEPDDLAKVAIRKGMQSTIQVGNCPYSLEKMKTESDAPPRIKVVWKEITSK